MARSLLNLPVEAAESNHLQVFYMQRNGGVSQTGQTNNGWGEFGNSTFKHGMTTMGDQSVFHCSMSFSQDHGTTWRASALRLQGNVLNNFSHSDIDILSLGFTSYNGSHDMAGDMGRTECLWSPGVSAGTTIYWRILESGNANGDTNYYNVFNFGSDNGSSIGGNTFGGASVRIVELAPGICSKTSNSVWN